MNKTSCYSYRVPLGTHPLEHLTRIIHEYDTRYKAKVRFELTLKVLQTFTLPLCYLAIIK